MRLARGRYVMIHMLVYVLTKRKLKGTFLIVTAQDDKCNVLTIAFAIVEGQNIECLVMDFASNTRVNHLEIGYMSYIRHEHEHKFGRD